MNSVNDSATFSNGVTAPTVTSECLVCRKMRCDNLEACWQILHNAQEKKEKAVRLEAENNSANGSSNSPAVCHNCGFGDCVRLFGCHVKVPTNEETFGHNGYGLSQNNIKALVHVISKRAESIESDGVVYINADEQAAIDRTSLKDFSDANIVLLKLWAASWLNTIENKVQINAGPHRQEGQKWEVWFYSNLPSSSNDMVTYVIYDTGAHGSTIKAMRRIGVDDGANPSQSPATGKICISCCKEECMTTYACDEWLKEHGEKVAESSTAEKQLCGSCSKEECMATAACDEWLKKRLEKLAFPDQFENNPPIQVTENPEIAIQEQAFLETLAAEAVSKEQASNLYWLNQERKDLQKAKKTSKVKQNEAERTLLLAGGWRQSTLNRDKYRKGKDVPYKTILVDVWVSPVGLHFSQRQAVVQETFSVARRNIEASSASKSKK